MDFIESLVPGWAQALMGAAALSWCLDTWTKLRTRPPWAPRLVLVTAWLTLFSALMILVGLLRWARG